VFKGIVECIVKLTRGFDMIPFYSENPGKGRHITGLEIDTPYYLTVRTETDAHGNNQNDLESENSGLINNIDDSYIIIFSAGFE